ncbi:pyruvate decarboxylase [Penicillium angulare]|uniref:Pyruvate decarboxylase n=1 Tax=Penicillium angulare TaxID=116970 RepID=A0A9W9K0A4_9EURO|nr:pyruvate decarboxylase [Penicillium angulare]
MTRAGSPQAIKIADYLFTRIRQLGIKSIFGVPGDYNLRLLDFVEPSGFHWIGNCNELNAAYAADGYARINGLSALITTYGVGELSAINGIAGAFAEKAGVIHIVGTPAREIQNSRARVHHTLADGDYRHFATMASHVTRAQTNILDPMTAPSRIDWVLQQALIYSQPVYIEIPEDMVDVAISASSLSIPISVPEVPLPIDEPVEEVLGRIYSAQRPIILVDGECRSMGILDQVDELVQKTWWPTWTTVFGKGLVNEELPNVYGHYSGRLGSKEWQTYFDTADLVIVLGPHYTDTNTYNFSTVPRDEVSISFSKNAVQIRGETFRDIPDDFLSRLVQTIDKARLNPVQGPSSLSFLNHELSINHEEPLVQKTFYSFVNSIFRENDLILTETGTAAHGGRQFKLPTKSRLFAPATWLSIGYMLPATLGAAVAHCEKNRNGGTRAILFIGDGSLQMSVQEISTIIHQHLNVIIFVINNAGYTIERAIHGRKQIYNDIAPWRHSQALGFFGVNEECSRNSFSARTYGELGIVLHDENIMNGTGVRLIEVFMGREDVEGALLGLMQSQIAKE